MLTMSLLAKDYFTHAISWAAILTHMKYKHP